MFPKGGMNVANVGNMVVTNSSMSGPGMLGGGIINNVNKQQLPTLMANSHHPAHNAHAAPQHHPHAQVSTHCHGGTDYSSTSPLCQMRCT